MILLNVVVELICRQRRNKLADACSSGQGATINALFCLKGVKTIFLFFCSFYEIDHKTMPVLRRA
ncbi:hypothetical protein DVQ78_11845 [Yersinia enterocolitica]|nr:hypothetical protein [Yersinia enterocolitica]